jgi:hypothetical protein
MRPFCRRVNMRDNFRFAWTDAVYQPCSLFGEQFEKAKAKDPNTFSIKDSRDDRRIVLGQAKTWEWDNAWQIVKRTAELLGV